MVVKYTAESCNIMKDDLMNTLVDGHEGLIMHLSDALQDCLFFERALSKFPEYNRRTEEEIWHANLFIPKNILKSSEEDDS